jgi:hypothetical protein
MKNFVVFFLLFTTFLLPQQYQQAELIIPLTITFSVPPYPPPYTGIENLEIGLDPTATDGLDPHLGEIELLPIPPPGHPASFKLPDQEIYVKKDFRYGVLPYTGVKSHRIKINTDGTEPTIHWAFPAGVTGQMKDLFGGMFVDIPMTGSGSYLIPSSENIFFLSILLLHIRMLLPLNSVHFMLQ